MKVRIPTPLRSYTDQRAVVDGEGRTVDELLADLDRRYPGIRFRVVDEQGRLRKHMKVFVAEESVRDLATAVDGLDEVVIMQALSGGADEQRLSTDVADGATGL
jgi:molybdopterin converting factor small subunit